MANKADSSAHGKANPCGHPACIFVGKTTGHIDLRLTLPKLHLATLKKKQDGEMEWMWLGKLVCQVQRGLKECIGL